MSSFNRTWLFSFIALIVILISAGLGWASQYFAWFKPRIATEVAAEPTNYTVTPVATGLKVPWSLVFTGPNRLLISEREGNIRVMVDGAFPNPSILYHFDEVSASGEEGLMSLVLDPEYAANKILYAALAYKNDSGLWVKVVSMIDRGDHIVLGKTILDKIPAAQYHAGTAMAFGPDKKLYISTGDATNKDEAQNLQSLSGKILRINGDGTIPSDNPYPSSTVYSFGHRNPQGLAWLGNHLYESEHGPSLFDGPAGGDELNLIVASKNYGWPLVSHTKHKDGTEYPLWVFTPAEAPASLLAYTGKMFPEFKDNLFFGALKGEGIVRAVIDPSNPGVITRVEKLPGIDVGRVRAVVQGPDGAIYFSTSNRDGRGNPSEADDQIFKIQSK